MPSGSRKPAIAYSVRTTAAKAPSIRLIVSPIALARSPDPWWAISAAIASVSELDRSRICWRASSSRSAVVLVRLPLWPSAIVRPLAWRTTGCAFCQTVEPVVE